jgi:hypothetical protein
MNYMGAHSALILSRRCDDYEEEVAHLELKLEIMTEVLMAAQESWMRNLDDATDITYMARDALDKCSKLETVFAQKKAREWAERDAKLDLLDRAAVGL